MRAARPQAAAGSAAPWLVLGGLLVVPVLAMAGWFVVAHADNPTAAAAPVDPILVTVAHEDVTAQTVVSIALVPAVGAQVTTSASGTVTKAPTVGSVLNAGDVVLRVNDLPVRAFVGDAPLWRVLTLGDKGDDVRRLETYLSALDYYTGELDGDFGANLRAAVARFNADGGRGTTDYDFDPASVAWIGTQPMAVAKSLVAVGASVGPGTAVVEGPGTSAAVTVTEPQGGIATVGEFGDEADLVVGDARVAYTPGSGVITEPDAVEKIRAALEPATSGVAQVSATVSTRVATVPASALVQGADGTVCVYPSADAEPVAVSPVGGGVGSAQLPDDVAVTTVLSNPGRVALLHPCGS